MILLQWHAAIHQFFRIRFSFYQNFHYLFHEPSNSQTRKADGEEAAFWHHNWFNCWRFNIHQQHFKAWRCSLIYIYRPAWCYSILVACDYEVFSAPPFYTEQKILLRKRNRLPKVMDQFIQRSPNEACESIFNPNLYGC